MNLDWRVLYNYIQEDFKGYIKYLASFRRKLVKIKEREGLCFLEG